MPRVAWRECSGASPAMKTDRAVGLQITRCGGQLRPGDRPVLAALRLALRAIAIASGRAGCCGSATIGPECDPYRIAATASARSPASNCACRLWSHKRQNLARPGPGESATSPAGARWTDNIGIYLLRLTDDAARDNLCKKTHPASLLMGSGTRLSQNWRQTIDFLGAAARAFSNKGSPGHAARAPT